MRLSRGASSAGPDRLLGATAALALNVVVTSGFGALAWLVAARLLDTEQLARDLALVTAMAALASVAELGGTVTLPRFLPVLGHGSGRTVTRTYVGTSTVAAGLAVAFLLVAPRTTDAYAFLGHSLWLQVLFVVAVCASTVFTLQDAVLVAFRAARWVTVENALFAVGKLVLFLALVAAHVPHPFFVSWVVGLLVAVPAVNLLLVPGLLPQGAVTAPSRAEMSRFAVQASATVVVAHVATTFLPVVVFALAGPVAGACFAVAFTFAVALENVAVGLGIALTVEGSYDEAHLDGLVRRGLRVGMPLLAVVCVATAVAAPVLLLAFGPQYAESGTTVLRLLALAALPQGLVHLYVAACRVRRQSGRIMCLQLALTLSVFVAIFALEPGRGLGGVGLGWLLVHVVAAALVLPALVRGRAGTAAGERVPGAARTAVSASP